jgi:acetyltransferase-like isoleucine patch superfamily enzyme
MISVCNSNHIKPLNLVLITMSAVIELGETAIGEKYTHGSISVLYWSPENDIKIGKFCTFGANIVAYLGGNHDTNRLSTYPFGYINTHVFNNITSEVAHSIAISKGPIRIGNDVWIGSNVRIMSGVTIGDGAVIANSSHVVKDVAPYSIVGGNPANFIRYRFTESQIKRLLEIKWWDWTDEKINQNLPLMCTNDIDAFINAHLKRPL